MAETPEKVIVPAVVTMKCTVYAPLDLHKALWQRRIDLAAHPPVSESFIEGARLLLAQEKAARDKAARKEAEKSKRRKKK